MQGGIVIILYKSMYFHSIYILLTYDLSLRSKCLFDSFIFLVSCNV
jgi:hypothetical protein